MIGANHHVGHPVMLGEFVRFANSGAIGTVIHYMVLWSLVNALGASAVWASTAGALAGALTNYVLNYWWTFSSVLPHHHSLPRFLIMAAASLGLNFILMQFMVNQLAMYYLVAQVLATLACLGLNYLVSRYWVFRSV